MHGLSAAAEEKHPPHVIVLVLGDIGRSPRMQLRTHKRSRQFQKRAGATGITRFH